jgi:hypothetical protein
LINQLILEDKNIHEKYDNAIKNIRVIRQAKEILTNKTQHGYYNLQTSEKLSVINKVKADLMKLNISNNSGSAFKSAVQIIDKFNKVLNNDF